jgi:hypothetical protein
LEGPADVLLEAGELKHYVEFITAPRCVEDVESGSVVGQEGSQFIVAVAVRGDGAVNYVFPQGEGREEFRIHCVEGEDQSVEVYVFLYADVMLFVSLGGSGLDGDEDGLEAGRFGDIFHLEHGEDIGIGLFVLPFQQLFLLFPDHSLLHHHLRFQWFFHVFSLCHHLPYYSYVVVLEEESIDECSQELRLFKFGDGFLEVGAGIEEKIPGKAVVEYPHALFQDADAVVLAGGQ